MARNRYSQTSPLEAFSALGQGLQGLAQAMDVSAQRKREMLGNQALSMALGSLANPDVRVDAETYMEKVNNLASAFQKIGLSPLPFYQMALQTVPKSKTEQTEQKTDLDIKSKNLQILTKKYDEMTAEGVLPENLEFFFKRVMESPGKFGEQTVRNAAKGLGYSDAETGDFIKQSAADVKLTEEQEYYMDILKYSGSYTREAVDKAASNLIGQGILPEGFKPSYRKEKSEGMTGEEWMPYPSFDPTKSPIKLKSKHIDRVVVDIISWLNENSWQIDSPDYKKKQSQLERILQVSYGAGAAEEESGETSTPDENWRMDVDTWRKNLSDKEKTDAEELIKANPALVTWEWLYRNRDAQ